MKIDNKKVKKGFYIGMFVTLFVWGISIIVTHASSLQLYLWHPGSSFYDFFTCIKGNIYWNRKTLYGDGSIYPPLANLIYVLISRCMSISTLKEIKKFSAVNDIKSLQECALYFVLYMNVLLIAYFCICTKLKKGSDTEKVLFATGMLFTIPFIYQFERANIIFLALILLMLFLLWKDSDNKIKREMALVALAASAGIKIYPAIFGVLLLKEKRYKEAARLVIYGIIFFTVPFIFFGGIQKNLVLLLHNLTNTAGQFSSTRLGCQLDFSTTFKFLFRKMGSQGNFIVGTLRMILAILGVVSVFCLKKTWKTILLMVCLIIGVPSISYTYTAIFMILPIIYFLDSGEIKKWDLLYLVGMLLVMVPIPFCWTEGAGDPNYAYMNVTIPMLIECVALVIMSVSLIVEGIINLGCRKWVKICGIVVVFIISVVPNVATLNLPYAYTDYLKKTLSDKIELEDGDYLEQTFIPKKEKVTHIVLKLKSPKKGSLEISVKQCNNESLIITKEYDLSKSQNGYNEIDLNNIEVESGKKYQIRIVYKNSEDKKIKIWKTVDNYMDEDNILTLNGEALNGELGIQIYEK